MKTKLMILAFAVVALAGCSGAPPSTGELKQVIMKEYDLGTLADLSCSVNKDGTKELRTLLEAPTEAQARQINISGIKARLGGGSLDQIWMMSCTSEGHDVLGFLGAGRGPDGKIHIWEAPGPRGGKPEFMGL